jgi:membrane associated rhomboid family serine protease
MQGAQFQAPPLSKTNKIIIITMIALFVLNSIVGGSLAGYLALSLNGIKSGLIYQIITYPFMEASFMGLIFESLIIWFIGSDLERQWGQKFYLQLFAVTAVSVVPIYLALSAFTGMNAPLMGITGFGYALLVSYAIIYSERQLTFMLLFPMKAKYFCLLLAGIQLYMGFFSGSGAVSFAHLGSMVFAFVFLQYKSMKARGGSLSSSINSAQKKHHKNKMRGKLKIVEDEPVDAPRKEKHDPKDPKFWQ